MLRNPFVTFFILVFFSCLPKLLSSQCLTAPPLDSCNGTEPALTDNEFLGSGIKKCYYGGMATYNALTMRGGTLVVCGDLTIDKFTMDSGTIVIRPGARFVVGTGIGYGLIFKGNAAVYNYGRFECRRNLTLDWPFPGVTQPSIVMNVTSSSVFDAQFVYFGISSPNSFFVNKGKAQFHGITTDAAASTNSICLGGGSEIKMNVLYNRARLPYNVFGGQACVQVTTFSQFYDTLTRNPNVYVCLAPSHSSDASCGPWGCRPNAWGTTSVFSSCNMCPELIVLPLSLYNFHAAMKTGFNELTWKTDLPPHDYTMNIERSADGLSFYRIDSIVLQKANREMSFKKNDNVPRNQTFYYRVRAIHKFTERTYSTPIVKISNHRSAEVMIAPNPFQQSFRIHVPGKGLKQVILFDMLGMKVLDEKVELQNQSNYEVKFNGSLPPGIYKIKMVFEKEVIVRSLIADNTSRW